MTCGLNTLKDAFLEIKDILVKDAGFKEKKAFRTAQRLMSTEAGVTFKLGSNGTTIKSVSYKKDGKIIEVKENTKDSNTNKEPDKGEKFMDKFQKVFKDANEIDAFNANYTHLEVNINGLIKFKGRKDSKEVKTYEEFKQISEELNSILLHTQKETIKDYSGNEAEKLIDGFYKMLSGSGIKFRPFELKLVAELKDVDENKKSVESLGMGVHTVRGGKNGKPLITMPSKRLFKDIYLPKVLLHEYAHAITVEGMRGDKGEEFNERAVKLREHVIKELKNKGKTDEYINGAYGLSGDSNLTGYEFIAEAMTSPQLQSILVNVASISKNKNALEDIRNLFKAIMNYVYKNNSKVDNNMQTALDEALDIVIEIQVAEGRLDKQEPSQVDSLESQSFNTEDSGLDIVESFSVLKKDDIEGFKDIMSKNKKECEL